MNRRSFLALAGTGALALLVESCSSGKAGNAASSTASGATTPSTSSTTARTTSPSTTAAATTTVAARPRRAGERPDPAHPAGTDRLPQIDHLVILMMENHSYDNYLGVLGRGDGFHLGPDGKPTNANADAQGHPVRAFHMANTCQLSRRPSQAWNATHTQWNHGAMDGFVRSDSGPVAMGYWTADDLPFYYGLASTFPVCDRWFASCMGQTYPNRRFLLAATARGNIRTEVATLSDPPPPNGTIMEALARHGLTWKNYYSNLPTVGLYLPVLATNQDKVVKVDAFFADAASGKLPHLSIVDPDFDHGSEENPADISVGEAFAASVINAVMKSPAWPKTLLVWLYDEHGGYYDHVPPPPAVAPDNVPPKLQPGDVPGDYARYGFRVPAVVVSPWAKRNYASHVVHDHTSILSFLEHKYNLPALTGRDGAADNLMDALDFSGPMPFAKPPVLPAPKNRTGRPLCRAAGPIPNPAG